jgi:transposase-like protein
VDGDAHTNGIESVWAVLKRSYMNFHFISKRHLPLYLDELTFRLNEGNCKFDTIDRIGALIRGVKDKRLTYRMLTHGI